MKKLIIVIILLSLPFVCFGAPDTTMSMPNPLTDGTTAYGSDVIGNLNEVTSKYNSHSHGDFSSTTSTTWTIGNNTDVNHDFITDNGDANNPRIRYNATTNRWTFANDGSTYNNMVILTTDLGYTNIAWINFNMSTDAIGDSHNVTSITDGAGGTDTINWSITFGNANYCTTQMVNGGSESSANVGTKTTTALTINTYIHPATGTDATEVDIMALGD